MLLITACGGASLTTTPTTTMLTTTSQMSTTPTNSGDSTTLQNHMGLLYADSFDFPVKDEDANDNLYWGGVVQEFGHFYQEMGGYHSGEDWNLVGGNPDADLGKPVYAVANGQIEKVSLLDGLGYLVAIVHQAPPGLAFTIPEVSDQQYTYATEQVTSITSVYIHLEIDENNIHKGANVMKGSPIGTIMDPGGGPHLHFEIRHPDTNHSNNWSMAGDDSNWARVNGSISGYYIDLQRMVDDGLRNPTDFLKANSQVSTASPPTSTAPSGEPEPSAEGTYLEATAQELKEIIYDERLIQEQREEIWHNQYQGKVVCWLGVLDEAPAPGQVEFESGEDVRVQLRGSGVQDLAYENEWWGDVLWFTGTLSDYDYFYNDFLLTQGTMGPLVLERIWTRAVDLDTPWLVEPPHLLNAAGVNSRYFYYYVPCFDIRDYFAEIVIYVVDKAKWLLRFG